MEMEKKIYQAGPGRWVWLVRHVGVKYSFVDGEATSQINAQVAANEAAQFEIVRQSARWTPVRVTRV